MLTAVVVSFGAVRIVDVRLPTTDGHELILTRYTEPEPDPKLLLEQLTPTLPPQPKPKVSAAQAAAANAT